MLRRSRHDHNWTDEELEALVAETSGYDYEDNYEDRPKRRSTRRRIEELRDARKLRRSIDGFDDEWKEELEDVDSGFDDDYWSEWH